MIKEGDEKKGKGNKCMKKGSNVEKEEYVLRKY
jgi:hypothetical protein